MIYNIQLKGTSKVVFYSVEISQSFSAREHLAEQDAKHHWLLKNEGPTKQDRRTHNLDTMPLPLALQRDQAKTMSQFSVPVVSKLISKIIHNL